MYANDRKLISTLTEVQNDVIGVFRPRYSTEWELVVENDEGTLTTISVGTFLGLSTTIISEESGKLCLFPNGQTLTDMKKEPAEFYEWSKVNMV